MKIGWIRDENGKWYYLNQYGIMECSKYIDGYYIDENGIYEE